MGTGKTLHLTERFRRLDADTLEYEFTVKDPATSTRPFTGIIVMKKTDAPVYEFACHEGNYALKHILPEPACKKKRHHKTQFQNLGESAEHRRRIRGYGSDMIKLESKAKAERGSKAHAEPGLETDR